MWSTGGAVLSRGYERPVAELRLDAPVIEIIS